MTPTAVKPKGTPTVSALAIERVDVPTVSRPGRERQVNPYTDTVRALKVTTKEAKGEAAAIRVENDNLAKTVRKLQDAGREVGVTVRTLSTAVGATHTRITFWPVPKITHAAETAEAAAPVAKPEPPKAKVKK